MTGVLGKGERWMRRAPITEGASGQAISTGTLVVIEDYADDVAKSRLAPPRHAGRDGGARP